jgi:lactoylglutathione lyase
MTTEPLALAKPCVDFGLATNAAAPMLAFWQGEVGLKLDHELPIRRGLIQHRHDIDGTVLKINVFEASLPATPPSGYLELLIARPGLSAPQPLTDPDGNRVSLWPAGRDGVDQIAVRLGVRDLAAHRHFYADVLGLPEAMPPAEAELAFAVGRSKVFLSHDPNAPADATMEGPGWRYITLQVFKVDEVHARVVAAGGREGRAPVTLGDTARISMVRDPDANWIEFSQRRSLVGSLN